MIAVTFALPQESRDFCRALNDIRRASGGRDALLYGSHQGIQVVVAHLGIGEAAAERKMGALLQAERPTLVLAAGFAGGLDGSLKIGDLVLATNRSDAECLRLARTLAPKPPRLFEGTLVTTSEAIETPEQKQSLGATSGALAVDMETRAIATACLGEGVPLLALRAISDRAGDPLPVPFSRWFDLEAQRPRPAALLAYLATHPARIFPFARFVQGLTPAREALTEMLLRLLVLLGGER